jgi:hypothetical protein
MLVWDGEGAIHAGGGQPTNAFAGFCGQLRGGWLILRRAILRPRARWSARVGLCAPTFEPGRSFANELDYQHQLDGWCEKVNQRVQRRRRLTAAIGDGRQASAACPASPRRASREHFLRIGP